MRVAIWGFGKPVIDTIKILSDSSIEVVYVKSDYNRSDIDEFKVELKSLGFSKLYVDEVPSCSVDLIYTINYNRIIPETILKQYHIVNYHVGILPMWRGNSANGWAVINGADVIGYTIHEMVSMLDAGPIYYQFRTPYVEGETYIRAKQAMAEDYCGNLVQILCEIGNGKLSGKEQDGPFTYCAKFRPVDGIVNWAECTETILRRFYVFGPPLGTGLKFSFRDKIYSITRISNIKGFAPAVGIPGSIIYREGNSIWVKTGDTAVSIDEIMLENKVVDVAEVFMIGQRL